MDSKKKEEVLTYHLGEKLPKILALHPKLQKTYDDNVYWGRHFLKSPYVSDQYKISQVEAWKDPESAAMLRGFVKATDTASKVGKSIDTAKQTTTKGIENLYKKHKNIIETTPGAKEAYKEFSYSNLGGKKSRKNKRTKRLKRIKKKYTKRRK